MGLTLMKTTALVCSALIFLATGVFGQSVPTSWTTHYRLRMYKLHDTPGADSLNANWKMIDSMIWGGSRGPVHIVGGDSLHPSIQLDTVRIPKNLANLVKGGIYYDGLNFFGVDSIGVLDTLGGGSGRDSSAVHKVKKIGTGIFVTQVGDSVTISLDKPNIDTLSNQVVLHGASHNGTISVGTQTGDHTWTFPDRAGMFPVLADTGTFLATYEYVRLHAGTGSAMSRSAILDSLNKSTISLSYGLWDVTDIGAPTFYFYGYDARLNLVGTPSGFEDKTLTFPFKTGTIATLDDITSPHYADSAGVLTWGSKTIHGSLSATSSITASSYVQGTNLYAGSNGVQGSVILNTEYGGYAGTFSYDSPVNATWTPPAASGTLALTTDKPATAVLADSAKTAATAYNLAGVVILGVGHGGTSNNTYTSGKFLAYNGSEIVSTAYDQSSFAGGTTHLPADSITAGNFFGASYSFESGIVTIGSSGEAGSLSIKAASGAGYVALEASGSGTATFTNGGTVAYTNGTYAGMTVGIAASASSAQALNTGSSAVISGYDTGEIILSGSYPVRVQQADHATNATYANSAGTASVAAGVPWSGVTDKPSTFAPATHNNSAHSESYVTSSGSVSYANSAGTATDALKLNGQYPSYYQPAVTAITTANIAAQTVYYAYGAGAVTWGNVSGKPYASFGTMSQENVGVSGTWTIVDGNHVTHHLYYTNGVITGSD